VGLSEAELVGWNPFLWVQLFVDPFEYKFF